MDHIAHIEFDDEDSETPGFINVRADARAVGISMALVGSGDFEIFVSSEKAQELARALEAAAKRAVGNS